MTHAPLTFERKLWAQGHRTVAGIDEAGRGPLAGPVVAACVVLPIDVEIDGIFDSKKLSPKRREHLYDIIYEVAIAVGVGRVEHDIIDEINILNATRRAMEISVHSCEIKPDYLLIDAVELSKIHIPQQSIIKGDNRSQSIAAASIIAKVTRDREMKKWDKIYPEYGFANHKGYSTKKHREAIQTYGLCPIHRRSFNKKYLQASIWELQVRG